LAYVLSPWGPGESLWGRELALTPACGDHHDLTPRQIEGPYFKPRSPQRSSLAEPRIEGQTIILNGVVLSIGCKPIPGALLDFWQADDAGRYDLDGFRLRGHQFTDGEGRYRLETIVPGLYPGRTRHVHVKVQAPSQPILITQLYFPGETYNRRDSLFDPRLMMAVKKDDGKALAQFDFVLNVD